MTIVSPTVDVQLALTAATAGARVLPASQPLSAGTPRSGDAAVVTPFSGAVLADLEGPVTGRVAVLVGDELVTALAGSPLGGLDLAAALQPTLDVIAESLNGRVGAARQVDLPLVVNDLGGAFVAVPLDGVGPAAAILITDSALALAPAAELPRTTAPGSPAGSPADGQRRGIEMLHGVDMEVTVEIGRTRMTVRELLDLSPGAVLELDRAAGSPADLLVNGRLIAHGEVVVIDEDFGLRITEIVTDTAVG
jgi:flagellar motor switch protein FliN/FliY